MYCVAERTSGNPIVIVGGGFAGGNAAATVREEGFQGPVAMGLRSGHVSRRNVTLTMGVEAERTETAEGFTDLLAYSLKRSGPFLIELMI